MKDIVLAIATWLKADPAITAITGTRIYRKGSIPTVPSLPYISIFKIDPKRPVSTHNRIRIGKTRIQCTVFASTDPVADNLSELIADSLNGVSDTYMPPGVFVIQIDDDGARPDENTDAPMYMYHRDFIVKHNV
jgi:hypothetical protein